MQGALPVGAKPFATNKIQGKGEALPSVVDCVNPVVTQVALNGPQDKTKSQKSQERPGNGKEEDLIRMEGDKRGCGE